ARFHRFQPGTNRRRGPPLDGRSVDEEPSVDEARGPASAQSGHPRTSATPHATSTNAKTTFARPSIDARRRRRSAAGDFGSLRSASVARGPSTKSCTRLDESTTAKTVSFTTTVAPNDE